MKPAAAALALFLALPLAASAQDAPVAVTVGGSAITFDQPPVERVGRVYVPLRGVFERLGASVVYDGGKIAATRGVTTVALQIGSNAAVVNGAPATLDAPPFLIGARTLVPLRFIAQALGASVNYDGSTRTVAIAPPVAAAPAVVITPVPRPAAPTSLVRIEPAPNATVRGARPQISATFSRAVDANAVRVRLDGRDVTPNAYVSTRAVSYDPQYDLPYGAHQVIVTVPGSAGHWSFANAPQPSPNYLRDVSPANGTAVQPAFVVQGYTVPGSRVNVVAWTSAIGDFGLQDVNLAKAYTRAALDGRFAKPIAVAPKGDAVIDVRIESLAPDGGTVVRVLRLRPALLPRPK